MKTPDWLNFSENALLLGTGAGIVASAATQQLLYASAPLSVLVALGLAGRRRLEQRLDKLAEVSENTSQTLAGSVHQLQDQVATLPTPEEFMTLQRTVMAQNERTMVRFSQRLEATQQQLEQRLHAIETPDLSQVHKEMSELQDQYAYLCTSVGRLNNQMQRLSSLSRVEAAEADVAHLKTELMQLRVTLDALGMETRSHFSTLTDTVSCFDRRLREDTSTSDSTVLKEEVRELIKAISDLVPRRDFTRLAQQLKQLTEQQQILESSVMPGVVLPAVSQPAVQEQLDELQSAIAQLETQIETLPKAQDPLQLQTQLQTLGVRVEDTERYLQEMQETLMARLQLGSTSPQLPAQHRWIVDFQAHSLPELANAAPSDSRLALESAIACAQKRLTLVWPWAETCELDGAMVEQFESLLARQCRLDIGWCHRGDRREGRLLHTVNQRWQLESAQKRQITDALNKLLPLKQRYPSLFTFKILGTDENFLVCDDGFAILGVQPIKTANTVFDQLGLKLYTTDPQVIQRLDDRFEDPTIAAEDAVAYFNRATTRYDLGEQEAALADYNQVLKVIPDDPAAYNNRGLIYANLGQTETAIADFSQAVRLDSQYFAAYCNRGILFLENGQLESAVFDLTQASYINSNSPLPYFYRGVVYQKLGHLTEAIADFTAAVKRNQAQVALPLCYRAAAYQKMGEFQKAIADLENAALFLKSQKDARNLVMVQKTLEKLKGLALKQTASVHNQ
ncbi:MAG: tetratricopeptide repeat protein [Leptolyngbyaceae cyanobacterium SL_1_1]|nr:tetratricopeptide repeat protein [Leptolyngbyaceae cyanobacterium RM1_1_2]NJO08769.1 tetratricopeptide repeat protein [Leptolyngbyaceae cyanobacterium SL_1_1]